MEQNLTTALSYLPRITAASADTLLGAADLTIAREGAVQVCYAPFDHIAAQARLVVVGITPGMTQAANALRAAHQAREQGLATQAVLEIAKRTASFSGGVIRSNLVAMLDGIGVAGHFGIATTADMFRPGASDVHFTSALRYPVFVDGRNYNGAPDMLRSPLLRSMVEEHLAEEARILSRAIWLPLGPKADAAVSHLVRQGCLPAGQVLSGLPHPSGANAERVSVFLGRKMPESASRQTDPARLLEAFARLRKQITTMKGAAA